MQLLIDCLNYPSNRIAEIDPTVSIPAELILRFFDFFFFEPEPGHWEGIAPPPANTITRKSQARSHGKFFAIHCKLNGFGSTAVKSESY